MCLGSKRVPHRLATASVSVNVLFQVPGPGSKSSNMSNRREGELLDEEKEGIKTKSTHRSSWVGQWLRSLTFSCRKGSNVGYRLSNRFGVLKDGTDRDIEWEDPRRVTTESSPGVEILGTLEEVPNTTGRLKTLQSRYGKLRSYLLVRRGTDVREEPDWPKTLCTFTRSTWLEPSCTLSSTLVVL